MKNNKNKSDFLENCTILLQGRINKECIDLWIKNYENSKVVLSVWEDEDLTNIQFPDSWKLIVNQYPLIRFKPHANLDYQIITTIKGLYKVETEWVVKMRCDEYWSNVETIYDKMKSNPYKIVTGSMFFRKWGMYPFHCSDKILGGTVDNLFAMFESTLHNIEINYWNSTIPESQLGLGWIMVNETNFNISDYFCNEKENLFNPKESIKSINKATDIVFTDLIQLLVHEINLTKKSEIDWEYIKSKMIYCKDILSSVIDEININKNETQTFDEKTLMRRWFEIIDINELKPYIATRNIDEKRIWYRDNFDHKENDCLTDINQNLDYVKES